MDDSFARQTILLVVLLEGARLATVPVRLPTAVIARAATPAPTIPVESVLSFVRRKEDELA